MVYQLQVSFQSINKGRSKHKRKSSEKGSSSGRKVREDNFSPSTKRLAIASKNHIRFQTVNGNAFPVPNAVDRYEFLTKVFINLISIIILTLNYQSRLSEKPLQKAILISNQI
jgi:hypothetical protein